MKAGAGLGSSLYRKESVKKKQLSTYFLRLQLHRGFLVRKAGCRYNFLARNSARHLLPRAWVCDSPNITAEQIPPGAVLGT